MLFSSLLLSSSSSSSVASTSSTGATLSAIPPALTVTLPTPARPDSLLDRRVITPDYASEAAAPFELAASRGLTSTPTRRAPAHRLLYRGSLLLENSEPEMLLEGICFLAHHAPSSPTSLLSSPLPLALESMRGRPNLRIRSTVQLSSLEGRIDVSGNVKMHVHPQSYLAIQYFERLFCHEQIEGAEGRTKLGIQVALGDAGGNDTEDFVVFGQITQSYSVEPSAPVIQMITARILPIPRPSARLNLPRPDDPMPRDPLFAQPRNLKRVRSLANRDSESRRNTKARTISIDSKDVVNAARSYQIPKADDRNKGKGKAKAKPQDTEDDPFLIPSAPAALPPPIQPVPPPDPNNTSEVLEATNKSTIKKLALSALTANGVSRDHPEFKEIFGWVTRGVGYALRATIRQRKIEREKAKALILSHVRMYVPDEEAGAAGREEPGVT
ncbi:hypothetical protein BOTBODRAFT_356748 [Botryobasidium botryosum FD-172 SS1]|uniref:Sld7 C-terminal domain-containing protein n=1 Tax=Botryobasidium botryosum (strain FD-172 SS1) TaxID=930990 RepID=A0A067MQX7_BOTB1|nr:hypothetical protein BOTBODRAFT_356748 [Botryobasidium botryosum FD-172 SS1]